MTSTATVLADVVGERKRQDEKWGPDSGPALNVAPGPIALAHTEQQALVWASCHHGITTEEDAKSACENAFRGGVGSWAHILVEEVSEAVAAATLYDYAKSCGTALAWADRMAALRAELIQVAAVAVKWVEHLDRGTEVQHVA